MLVGVMSYSRKMAPNGNLDETGDANAGYSTQVRAYLKTLRLDQRFDCLPINCGLHDIVAIAKRLKRKTSYAY